MDINQDKFSVEAVAAVPLPGSVLPSSVTSLPLASATQNYLLVPESNTLANKKNKNKL